ncbi:L,D-transpeptidase [bacterium]|nr:L,D-transpeptidase [bacterium]
MKIQYISNIYSKKFLKQSFLMCVGLASIGSANLQGQNTLKNDYFIKTEIKTNDSPKDFPLLTDTAPIPVPIFEMAGECQLASAVVDLSQNKLYHYDSNGFLLSIHPVASGKHSTPTKAGIRKIINIESYPYQKAPESSKRYKNPSDYGPRIIILAIIDQQTGEISGYNGQYLHGTNNPSSIGKYASKGCIRMYNKTIKELSTKLKKGQYIIIKE